MKRKLFIIGGSTLILLFLIWLSLFLLQSSRYQGVLGDDTPPIFPSPQGIGSISLESPLSTKEDRFFSNPSTPLPNEPPLAQKKIIKNGFLTLVVERTEEAVSAITKIVEGKSGFIASLSVNDGGDKGKQASITARIPFNQFSGAFEEIKVLAEVVEAESVSGQDVTEQFIDLEAHLKNLRATEAQFLEVLKTAKTVEDILKVQDRLSQVRGQIESLEGQIKYLANQTDLATITISLSEEPTVSLSFRDFKPTTVIKTSLQSLARGLIVIFTALVKFIFVVVPTLLISGIFVGAMVFILWRLMKKVKQKILTK